MSTKTQKAGNPAPREYDVTLGIRPAKRGKVKFIGNPRTLQEWEWSERDHPGLYDFLRDLLIRRWHPLAVAGKKFTAGRKPGTGGPIRKAIARLLKKDRAMKPRDVWRELAANPPRGWAFCETPRLGKYIEGPKGGQGMGYPHFSNACKEEKDKLYPQKNQELARG